MREVSTDDSSRALKLSDTLSRPHRSLRDRHCPSNLLFEPNEHFQAELVPFAAHEIGNSGLWNA